MENKDFHQAQQVPQECTVLVVGGGPGGSYAATVLAREGIDVVLLEADVFPRYHIGESLLPALRYLLRFIDLESTFNDHGFAKKIGAAFKMSTKNREAYTDFLAAYGQDQYVWNVLRSESDDIMFRHAEKSGAKVFDGVEVTSVTFDSCGNPAVERPIRATYRHKADERIGDITFHYIVDASGRAGLLSTKYFKNRKYNQSLKNVASWGYWKETTPYGKGTSRENAPFLEALKDESGWAWMIPLRDSTSVGLVMSQHSATKKKRSETPTPSTRAFYLEQLKLAPNLYELISSGELVSAPDGRQSVMSASDYSYSATFYGAPGLRIIGDAGAFIDPFYSSGVHLAVTGGMSAAASICAAMRGDCSEEEAASWHSKKVGKSYTWFLMVVLGAYRQMNAQSDPVLSDIDEDNFDRAFEFIKPVIQGTLDVEKHIPQEEMAETLNFCTSLFDTPQQPDTFDSLVKKLEEAGYNSSLESAVPKLRGETENATSSDSTLQLFRTNLTQEEKYVFDSITARKAVRLDDSLTVKSFVSDAVDGRRLRLVRGRLGLMNAEGEVLSTSRTVNE